MPKDLAIVAFAAAAAQWCAVSYEDSPTTVGTDAAIRSCRSSEGVTRRRPAPFT